MKLNTNNLLIESQARLDFIVIRTRIIFFIVLILFVFVIFSGTPKIVYASWAQSSKLLASDGMAYDNYGDNVAMSDDIIVIGAPEQYDFEDGPGKAYVYKWDGSSWGEVAQLLASDGAVKDHFGSSVSFDNDTIVVGAYSDGDNGSKTGSAYIFEKPAGGWSGSLYETAKVTASDGSDNSFFGMSVSINGDTIVVGTNHCSSPGDYCAYVFERPLSGWVTMTETAKLTMSEWRYNEFGAPVSISNQTIVVGAYGDDNDATWSGSAYVFEKPGSGWANMTETARLYASDGETNDHFGIRVSIENDTIVIGAHGDNASTGSAYVFEKPEGGWATTTEDAKLTADSGGTSLFSVSISISNNTIVAGAMGSGAYIFDKPVSGWTTMTETFKLTASDGEAGDYFGDSVAIYGNTIVVGAYGDDDNGTNSGSTYIFNAINRIIAIAGTNGSLDATTPSPQTVADSETAQFTFNANAGYHVSTVSGCGIDFTSTDETIASKTVTTAPFAESCIVTASFVINQNTVIAIAGTNGTLDTATPSPQTVADDGTTQFTFNANAGYHVSAVSGCGIDFTNSDKTIISKTLTTAPFTESCIVKAFFAISQYNITASAGANGILDDFSTPSPQILNYGETTQFTFYAYPGYHVSAVSGCGIDFTNTDETIATKTVTTTPITNDCSVIATFSINHFTVTASTGSNGTLDATTPSPQVVAHGSSTSFTFRADTNYHIDSVTGCNGTLVGNIYTTGAITSDCTVTSTFAINTYILNYSAGANGSLTGDTSQTVGHGSDGTAVKAVADGNYHFVDWSDGSTANPRADINVQANIDVTANFAVDTYTLTVEQEGKGQGTVTSDLAGIDCPQDCNELYNYGTTVELTATPNTHSSFKGWSGDCTGNDLSCTIQIDQAKNVQAHFHYFPWNIFLPAINNKLLSQ